MWPQNGQAHVAGFNVHIACLAVRSKGSATKNTSPGSLVYETLNRRYAAAAHQTHLHLVLDVFCKNKFPELLVFCIIHCGSVLQGSNEGSDVMQ